MVTIDIIVVINIALVIASGFTPYRLENINAINPTGADAIIIVVSEMLKSILFIVQIINRLIS